MRRSSFDYRSSDRHFFRSGSTGFADLFLTILFAGFLGLFLVPMFVAVFISRLNERMQKVGRNRTPRI